MDVVEFQIAAANSNPTIIMAGSGSVTDIFLGLKILLIFSQD